jgi:hypothetical protein
VTKNTIRSRSTRQQCSHPVIACLIGGLFAFAGDDKGLVKFDIVVPEGMTKSTIAVCGRAKVGTADVRKTFPSELNKVLCRQSSARIIISSDKAYAQLRERAVN